MNGTLKDLLADRPRTERQAVRRAVLCAALVAVASVALVFFMGGLAGVAAGFFGGWTDRIVGRIADTIMAFPLFVLAMAMVAALGNRIENIVIATAIINLPFYIRFARAEVNVRRNVGWVEAARACGESHFSV
ncbi:ABC transporter permease subunit, partial [Pseudomonas sp. EL_65y_Pfl1_R83]|uniref:ABC transporter permease subunit n=1 Tax=Pseudomonas sp. EL_65y_Pfl1_R83 TaxID=3088697 RepID=UPI0030D8F648